MAGNLFKGIQVDGNDLLTVYSATKDAVEKAGKGEGPTLIEAYTYRISDHTTADDASRYRNENEIKKWTKRDPIKRFKSYLELKGLLDNTLEDKIKKETEQMVDNAAKKAEACPAPMPEDIFKYTYAEMPKHLQEELDELEDSLGLTQ